MKVLLVTDVGNWAWAHKARAIKKYLKDDLDKIDVCTLKEFKANKFAKYNHVHIFGWMDRKGMAGVYKGFTAGVSSFNYLYKHLNRATKFLPRYDAITAVSELIYNDLKKRELNKNIYLCQNGVDETVFYPAPKKHNNFVVGWMGQPTEGGFGRGDSSIDMHGFQNVLLPLVESLENEKDIEFKIMAKTFKNAVPHSEMPAWYNGLDLFLHTGFGTGTPNGVFEAMACGVPCISTAIGAAPEVIENNVNGFLVPRYYDIRGCIDAATYFAELIINLKESTELCKWMGHNARDTIEKSWTWKQRAQSWLPVFTNHSKKI